MDRGIEHREEHTEVNYIVAHGISTTLYGEKVVIGSKHFILEDEQSDVSDEAKASHKSGCRPVPFPTRFSRCGCHAPYGGGES